MLARPVGTGRLGTREEPGGYVRTQLAAWWSARERGATAVEYALMAGLIALVIVAGVTALGRLVGGQFTAGAGLFS